MSRLREMMPCCAHVRCRVFCAHEYNFSPWQTRLFFMVPASNSLRRSKHGNFECCMFCNNAPGDFKRNTFDHFPGHDGRKSVLGKGKMNGEPMHEHPLTDDLSRQAEYSDHAFPPAEVIPVRGRFPSILRTVSLLDFCFSRPKFLQQNPGAS